MANRTYFANKIRRKYDASSYSIEYRRRFRWDKADVISYYHTTYSLLSQIPVCDELLDCLKKHSCNAQFCVNYVYDCMVNALSASAEAWVPRTKPGFYRVWWNDTLTELKRESVEVHDLWKISGRPKQGDVFMRIKRAKIAYKPVSYTHLTLPTKRIV